MESRKRKSSLENYIDGLTDPPEKQRKVTEFYNSLRLFYKRRWNAPLRFPHVQGVEVNLHRLYETVMALGGWQKVASGEKWSDIAEMLGCKEDIVCGDHAIKLIYMRYLSKFEQVETIGDVDDYVDNEMSRSRGRGATSFFATNDCPISQTRLNEYVPRDERGNIINEPSYSRLTKSLISGLPNEIDFTMNICMLLSHAGPRQLRVCHSPTLLTLLVAHTGVFDENDDSLMELGETWKKSTMQNFQSFWIHSGIPKDLLERFLNIQIKDSDFNDDDLFFTGVTEVYNVKDPKCWRLNQVATIIRNLSFEPVNRVTIVRMWPVLKFLILCASCRWAPLYTAAYDALSNLATDLNLTDKTLVHMSHHAILKIIHDGIASSDKFKLIRSLEMLTGLSAYEGNESIICDWLKVETITHIFDVVVIKDIMMCVYILECLYQLSEMGDTACDLIADSPNAIQQLVSMATLEAVSFGPAGLAGMKVVEYQAHLPAHVQQQQQQGPSGQLQIMQTPNPQNGQFVQQRMMNQQQQQTPLQPPPPQASLTVRQVIQSNLHHQQLQQQNALQLSNQAAAAKAHQNLGATIQVQPIVPSTNSGESHVEQLTEKWIKQNCVFEPAMSTPRGELYAAYVDDLRNQYHSLSGSLAMFSGVMKNLYPEVMFRMAENGVMIVAQGIRLVRPHRLAPSQSSSEKVETHPLMKKMLSEREPVTNGINGHSLPKSDDEEHLTDKKENAVMNGNHSVPDVEIFNENEAMINGSEVKIEKRERLNGIGEEHKDHIEKMNGKLTNGYTKQDGRKKASMASRAASIVAAATKLNGKDHGKGTEKKEKEEVEEEEKEEEKVEEEEEEVDDDDEKKATTSTESVETPTEESSTSETGNENKKKLIPKSTTATDFMCDWDCCSNYYTSPAHVLKHLTEEHVVEELRLLCRWNNCTDPTPRNRWSLITHIQDVHCNEHQLRMSSQKRKDGIMNTNRATTAIIRNEIVPRDISNHPGYAKNAAMDAIKRHAFNFLPRDITDEAEGPVTKSIRLTSCLILRNLARYSAEGRQKLRRHESHICWLALSRLESSITLSQLLSEMQQAAPTEEEPKGLSTVASVASLSSISSGTQQISGQVPDSPVSTDTTPIKNYRNTELSRPIVPKRTLNFSVTLESSEDTPEMPTSSSIACSSSTRHQSIQQHIPTQPSPLVQTTPVRAGAGH